MDPAEIVLPYVESESLLLVHVDDVAAMLVALLQAPRPAFAAYNALCESVLVADLKRTVEGLNSRIKIRLENVVPPPGTEVPEDWQAGQPLRIETTLGRCIFNEALPADFPFVNYEVGKRQLTGIVNALAEQYPKVHVAEALDNLKDAGFH